MSGDPPRKHHFAPVFYLKAFAGPDGLIEQFSRPYGAEVRARRLPPSATGFAEDLYSMPGLADPHLAQQVESRFMAHVDDLAAVELARLRTGKLPSTSEQRTAWSRFIQSLQLRTPADISGIRARIGDDWGISIPKIQETYASLKRIGDPATFEEFMTRDDPNMVERVAMKAATVLIDHPDMGSIVNNMTWAVLDLTPSNVDLVISDRPVEQVFGLGDPRAFLTLPVGPRQLFVAAHRLGVIANLRTHHPSRIVRARNRSTVGLARDYVWAGDRRQDTFIRKHFGSIDAPTLGERLANAPD